MKSHGLVQRYFPWTAQHYNNQVLAFTKSLVYAQHILYVKRRDQAFVRLNSSKGKNSYLQTKHYLFLISE